MRETQFKDKDGNDLCNRRDFDRLCDTSNRLIESNAVSVVDADTGVIAASVKARVRYNWEPKEDGRCLEYHTVYRLAFCCMSQAGHDVHDCAENPFDFSTPPRCRENGGEIQQTFSCSLLMPNGEYLHEGCFVPAFDRCVNEMPAVGAHVGCVTNEGVALTHLYWKIPIWEPDVFVASGFLPRWPTADDLDTQRGILAYPEPSHVLGDNCPVTFYAEPRLYNPNSQEAHGVGQYTFLDAGLRADDLWIVYLFAKSMWQEKPPDDLDRILREIPGPITKKLSWSTFFWVYAAISADNDGRPIQWQAWRMFDNPWGEHYAFSF